MEMRDLHWSHAEKQLARRAFQKALENEKNALILKFKDRAAKIKKIEDLWKLVYWAEQRGKEINEKYDYRYSVLPMVFGRLIREHDIEWQDLAGLGEDKMEFVRAFAGL
jgi:hypothetical protein